MATTMTTAPVPADAAEQLTRAVICIEDALSDALARELPSLPRERRQEIAYRQAAKVCEIVAQSHDMTALAWRMEGDACKANADTVERMQR